MDKKELGDVKLVYEQTRSYYEEWGGIRIYEDEHGAFYESSGGYSVMASEKEPEWSKLYPVSGEMVLDLIDEWEEIVEQDDEYWRTVG